MAKLAVQTKGWYDAAQCEASLQMLCEAGFNAVDYSADALLPHLVNMIKKPETVASPLAAPVEEVKAAHAELKDTAKRLGITVAQVTAPALTAIPDREDINTLTETALFNSLELCAYLEAPILVVTLPTYPTREEQRSKNTELLCRLGGRAAELNVRIALLNDYNGQGARYYEGAAFRSPEAMHYVNTVNEALGRKVLGICFSTGNANAVGAKAHSSLTDYGDQLIALQLSDNNRDYDICQIPFTQSNRIAVHSQHLFFNWDAFLSKLGEINYQGDITFNVCGAMSDFPAELRADALRLTAAVGRYIAQKIAK